MPGLIHTIQVDEEGEGPKAIDCQIEGVPVNVITIVVEVLLKGDSQRCPDNVEEDDKGENTVIDRHILTVHVELVPWDVSLLLMCLLIAIRVFAVGLAIRVGRDPLVEHLCQLALLHVILHIVQAPPQENEQPDLAPKLPDSLLALVCVHGTPWLVFKFLPTSYSFLHLRLVKHSLDSHILILFLLSGRSS